jgi:hypothetical protein
VAASLDGNPWKPNRQLFSRRFSSKLLMPPWSFILATALLMGGGAIYLRGFIHTLPYHFNPDEPQIYLFVDHLLTTGNLQNSYPPLRIIGLSVEFWLLDLITPGGATEMTRYIFGRVSTILYVLILMAATYQTGRQLHSSAAGLAAMAFLIAQPQVVRNSKVFLVDSFAWMLGMMGLAVLFYGMQHENRRLLLPALLLMTASTFAKYTMIEIFIVAGVALVGWFPRTPLERTVIYSMIAAVLVAGILVAIFPPPVIRAFLVNRGASWMTENGGRLAFVSLQRVWSDAVRQLGAVNFWLVVAGLPLTWMLRACQEDSFNHKERLMIVGLLLLVLVTYLVMGTFGMNRDRDRFLIVLGFAPLWGMTLASLVRGRLALLVPICLLLLPWYTSAWQYSTALYYPDTRQLTADWFIENAPSGVHIAVEYDHSEFLAWGGYSGKIFFVESITSVYEESLEDFKRRGIEYIIADFRSTNRGGFYDLSVDQTTRQAFLDEVEIALNLDNPYARDWRGPSRWVFQVTPLQDEPMHVFVGDAIIFKGYDLGAQSMRPGETLELVLYWSALHETDANYTVFAHVLDAEGKLVAQRDGLPGDAEHRTYQWWPGYFDWDEWPITLPSDLSSGVYTLRIGMYDSQTQIRLPVTAADGTPLGDGIVLTQITVSGN